MESLPYVYEATAAERDLLLWMDHHSGAVDEMLLAHGAILFRGFSVTELHVFERLLSRFFREVIGNYGDLPPEKGARSVYSSTPYPASESILFHNESAHMHTWPQRQAFGCMLAASSGGETPLVDCRRIYQALPPGARDKFIEKGLLYVRHFVPGLDVSWQEFFKTPSRDEVARMCRARAADCEWKTGGVLRVAQCAPAVIEHPRSGERSFFNQIMLHHPFYLCEEEREALEGLCGDNLPRQVFYGDGTPIEEDVLACLPGIYARESRAFPWQRGDVLLLDNMLVAHSRRPFTGARRIVVGLGDPYPNTVSSARAIRCEDRHAAVQS